MHTESPNFGQRFDPFCVCKWPVSTEVRSHFRMFVTVEVKNFGHGAVSGTKKKPNLGLNSESSNSRQTLSQPLSISEFMSISGLL